MSVLKSKRKESKFEVFHNFYKLRKELTELVYRRFGYKGEDTYKLWFINNEAQSVLKDLADAQRYITIANSIYPNCLMECDERRIHQVLAIGLLYDLVQELQFVLEMLPCLDKNKYVRHSDILNKEIALLKGWRESDNATRTKIQGNF